MDNKGNKDVMDKTEHRNMTEAAGQRHSEVLSPEDYVEPVCLLCGEPYGAEPKVKRIPQQRIIEKLDEYMSRRDYDGAERHLLYWMEEAKLGGDIRGKLVIYSELIGHYRKTLQEDKAMECIAAARKLLKDPEFEGTVAIGTVYVNIATACSAFGKNEEALAFFEKAREVYEDSRAASPELLGGLYNNMGVCCRSLKRFDEAERYFAKALEKMAAVAGGEPQQAITWLNLADTAADRYGMEEAETRINECLDQAAELLDTEGLPWNGEYAFVCEKCAPVFAFYGYFLEADELARRSRDIYGITETDRAD